MVRLLDMFQIPQQVSAAQTVTAAVMHQNRLFSILVVRIAAENLKLLGYSASTAMTADNTARRSAGSFLFMIAPPEMRHEVDRMGGISAMIA